jgi:ubiquinone/menaquinone biosynthesis C-methylase UbiE
VRAVLFISAVLFGALLRPDVSPVALDWAGKAMLEPLRFHALVPQDLVARLRLEPTSTVADVGAGPGFMTEFLARAVPQGHVIATDIKSDYLRVLSARMRRAGIANVETQVTSRESPELAPASVDLVFLCQVDHYLADRVAYLRTIIPSLRPGGRIVLVNYARYREPDLSAAQALSLRVVDEWSPSPPFFVLVLAPGGEK